MQKHLQSVMVFAALVILVSSASWDVNSRRKFKRQNDCEYNLCNTTDGYPSDLIAQIAEKHSRYSKLFGDVVQPHKPTEIVNRFNTGRKENMCLVRSLITFPTKALDINHSWQTVVNVEGYRQGVSFEACVENTSCFAAENVPLGYTTSCEQQYITLRMVVLNDNEELTLEKFPVPSGCACVYATNSIVG